MNASTVERLVSQAAVPADAPPAGLGGPAGNSSAGGVLPSPPAVLDLVELCPRCSVDGRRVVHGGTVCPVSGIEHSSRGAMRDHATPCVCGGSTWNWRGVCDRCKAQS